MATFIDLAISISIFFAFISLLLILISSFLSNYISILKSSELVTIAKDYHSIFFDTYGLPEKWSLKNVLLRPGLKINLYQLPILIKNLGNPEEKILNFSYVFDKNCELIASLNSIRIFDKDGNEVEFQLYNETYCQEPFIKEAEIVFKIFLDSNEEKLLFLYFSEDREIKKANYTLSFPNKFDWEIKILPLNNIPSISVEKLRKLRNYDAEEVAKLISPDYMFKIEVSEL